MKRFFFAALLATLFTSMSHAQHSDIEFGFEDPNTPVFEIEIDLENSDGIQVAEGSFETNAAGFFPSADNPGFITPVSATENLTVNAGDQVFINVLNAGAADSPSSVGVGFVNFFTEADGIQNFDSSFGTLEISGNDPDSDNDIISSFAGDTLLSGPASIFLAEGSDGNTLSDLPPSLVADGELNEILGPGQIHNHLGFDLTGELAAPGTEGAIGLLLEFSAVLADSGETVTSDPFFLVFNHGLDEEIFETQALAAFGVSEAVAVPEPAAGIVLTAMASAILTRRRRRT